MKKLSFKATQISASILVAIFIVTILIWEKFHGGVVTHHILKRNDLPGISNWWGLPLLPFICWLSFNKIQKRIERNEDKKARSISIRNCILGFIGALVFGILLSSAFSKGYTNFSDYLVDSLLLLFFLVPIYRSEYILGFILGMTTAIGAILPTAFALIIALASAIIYLYIRPLILRLFRAKEKKQ
jgi:hypothetical protein